MKNIKNTALAFAFAVAFSLTLRAQNIIINGSFELGAFNPTPDRFQLLPVGSTVMPGWTVSTNNVVWGKNGNMLFATASQGSFFINLTGWAASPPFGSLAQTLITPSGQSYHLSLDIGIWDLAVGPVMVSVAAGPYSQTFTHAPVGTGNQWATYGFDFTAGSATTPIVISGISTGNQWIGVDNVAVVPIPEPSLLALAGLAAVVSAGASRHRKVKN